MEPDSRPTVYLTREQIWRLAGVAVDAMVGIQLHTDARDDTSVTGEFVHVDHPFQDMNYFSIDHEGRYKDET